MASSRYRVIGPHGEGPVEVTAATSLEAAAKAKMGYGLVQPRGIHGAVIAYRKHGNVSVKVGAFDITWLSHTEE